MDPPTPPTLLDYRPTPPRRPWNPRPMLWAFGVIGVVYLVGYLLTTVTVRRTTLRVDAVTGSEESETVWPMGITAGPTLTPSPLEVRLTAVGVPWTRDWHTVATREHAVLGVTRGSSPVPPIYLARGRLLAEFVAAASDDEVRAFARTMQSGTPAQRQAAVDAATGRALDAMRSRLPTTAAVGPATRSSTP